MGTNNGFTPLERRMLDLLSDGLPHLRSELHACCEDELSRPASAVGQRLSKIRKKIRPVGEDIICRLYHGKLHYQHIKVLSNPENPA